MALKHYTFWTWYQLLLRVARRAPSTLSLHILLLGVRASVIACNQTEHIFDPHMRVTTAFSRPRHKTQPTMLFNVSVSANTRVQSRG